MTRSDIIARSAAEMCAARRCPASVAELEDALSEPTPNGVEAMRRLEGDVILLGVGGKIGPSLAQMVRRASDAAGVRRRVIGVSRFSDVELASRLQAAGVETIRCDLLDESAVMELPEAANVIFLAGMKFGATGREPLTWATNAWLPAVVCRKFQRGRIVALSTGNIYGLTPVSGGGAREEDPPVPVGEYAMSCLGRERIFEYFSRICGIPLALIRLNYACDLRYGVLVDLAEHVWRGEPVDLAPGFFNTIWQGDANAFLLEALHQVEVPPRVVNVTGPEVLAVRQVCEELGQIFGRQPKLVGTETPMALLSNAGRSFEQFGRPRLDADCLVEWVAEWIRQGNPTLGKRTRYESRDGKF